jgi:hypothetical protein
MCIGVSRPALAQEGKIAPSFDTPPVFKASELLPAALLKGPHFQVDESVETPDYFHHFRILSDYGEFPAEGLDMLYTRLNEVRALAALDDVSKSEVFLKSAGGAVLHVGKSVVGVVTKPVETVKGIGAGVSRFAINLARKTSRAVSSKSKKGEPSAAESAVGGLLGVDSATRRWAQKLGVDPYTSNPVLRKALADIGKIDAAGSIATMVAVPIPTVLTVTSAVGDVVWTKDPEDLRRQNEQQLAELGVSKRVAKEFFANPNWTPSLSTVFVSALDAVRARGLTAYVEAASLAQTERDARFYTESAVLLQRLHGENPVEAALTGVKTMVVRTRDGRAIVLAPIDWLSWTAEFQKTLSSATERSRRELGASSLEMRLTGKASPEASRQIAALGWKLTESIPPVVEPPKPATP